MEKIPYSIDKLQDRGKFFVNPDEIYEGQVIGENSRSDDMSVNVTKAKKQSNVRSSGNDEKRELFLHYFLIRRSFRIHSKMICRGNT
jgi:predicted membrane GTPase involved in stress response